MLALSTSISPFLLLWGLICLSFYFLYKRLLFLDEMLRLVRLDVRALLRSTSSSSDSPPLPPLPLLPVNDKQELYFFFKVACVVAIAALVIIGGPSGSDMWEAAESLGLIEVFGQARPLAVWMPAVTGLGRYQWHAFDLENVTRYPVIECAMFENIKDLQVQLLGEMPDLATKDRLDPSLQREFLENYAREELYRSSSSRRCVLNPGREFLALDPMKIDYLTDSRQVSITEIVKEHLQGLSVLPLQNPVDSVLVARDGERFYRVSAIVRNASVPRGVSIERRVIAERDLLTAPRRWYQRFCDVKMYGIMPCICPLHFGLINTGFYFQRLEQAADAEDADPVAYLDMEAADCDRPWRLYTQARVLRPVTGSAYTTITMTYHPYPSEFPSLVNDKLNISSFSYPERTTVEAVDMQQLLGNAHTHALLEHIDPDWISYDAPVVNYSKSPLLSVMPLSGRILGAGGQHMHTLSGQKNICFGYCLHLDQEVLKKAGFA